MVDARRSFSFTSEVEWTDRRLTSWLSRLKIFLWSDWEGYQENIRMEHQQGNSVSLEGDGVLPGFSRYDDFHTIDWLRDITRDRRRHRVLQIRKNKSGSSNRCAFICDAATAWLCVSIVGVLCGCVAAFVDIGTSWLIDLKEGYCGDGFWFNRDQCCWSSNTSFFIEDDCDEWTTWAELFGYHETTSVEIYFWIQYLMFVLFGLLMAVLAALFVRTFAPYAGGGGIPELKTVLSGFIIRGLLGKWTMFIKMVGVMLAVASGLVLGKEGPMVHIACCIGNVVARLFPKYRRNEAKKREILSASAAAGVSVAFGAPIGGVLFSLEEISYYFPLKTLWRTFFCALVATFVLSAINPFGTDHTIVFYVEYTTPWIFIELFPFILLGAMGGSLAAVFIKANIFLSRLRKNTIVGQYPVAEVVIITLITVLVSFPNPYMRSDSNQLIALLVRDCRIGHHYDLCDYIQSNRSTAKFTFEMIEAGPGIARACWQLVIAFIVKFLLLVLTIGIKVPAGLYIPSLALGAIMGRLVGIGMEQLVFQFPDLILFQGECGIDCITPGLYAMVGAAAFLAGVTRMTVGLVVIMFEVTGGVRYIVPLMVAIVVSKWVADALSPHGIFEALIRLNEYPFLDAKEEYAADVSIASDIMRPKNDDEFVVLTQTGMTVGQIEKIVIESEFNGFPVVDSIEDKFLVGFVLRRDLLLALKHAKKIYPVLDQNLRVCFSDEDFEDVEDASGVWLRKIVDMACVTVTDLTSMATVTDMFKKLGLRHLLVTKKGKLTGIITKKDLLRHLQQVE